MFTVERNSSQMNNISRNSNLWGWHNRKSFEVIRNATIPFLCGNFEQSWMWSVFWQVAHAETHTWKFKIRCGCSKKKYVPADWCNCSRFWNIKLWEVETFYGKWLSKKKLFYRKQNTWVYLVQECSDMFLPLKCLF